MDAETESKIIELKTLTLKGGGGKDFKYLSCLADEIIRRGGEESILFELSRLSAICYDLENSFLYMKRYAEQRRAGGDPCVHGLRELVMNANRSGMMPEDEYIQAVKEIYNSMIPERVNSFAHRNANILRKIRVGLLSYDFHSHSVGKFISSLFGAEINNSGVEIFCYYTNTVRDGITEIMGRYADCFKYAADYSDARLGEEFLHDGLDILIDLNNLTAGNRLSLLAGRFAPVQMTWMGRPTTTATPNIDFNIGDGFLDSPDGTTGKMLTERIARMNPSYMCYALDFKFLPDVAAPPFRRNGYITFGNLTYPTKHSAQTLKLWSAVLKGAPGSKLYLKFQNTDEGVMQKYFERLARYGIDPERVTVAGYESMDKYFEAYNEIDILLDTAPYNGCTTLAESFLMGTPTVSLKGAYRQGRHCLFLRHVGLGDLAADTPEEYVRKAVDLAGDRERVAWIGETLRETARKSPLFDPAAFRKAFERLMFITHMNYCLEKENGYRFDGSVYENDFEALQEDCRRAPRAISYMAEEGRSYEEMRAVAGEYLEMSKLLLLALMDRSGFDAAIGEAVSLLNALGAVKTPEEIISVMSAVNLKIHSARRF